MPDLPTADVDDNAIAIDAELVDEGAILLGAYPLISIVGVRDEHGTYDWILEGLIERAGFRIDRKDRWDAIYADYTCTKIANCSVT